MLNKVKSLSLAMIVKNEEKYLEKCIASVLDIVDEIIIVDTGSTDRTINIAEKYTKKIYHYFWNDNFSDARNFTIEKATSEWILLLDADEELDIKSKGKLINFINTSISDGCNFKIHNYIDTSYNSYTTHNGFRLLRNNGKYKYSGRIHEQIVSKNGVDTSNNFCEEDIILYHYGYIEEIVNEKDKRNRNIPLIIKTLEENPTDSFSLFNLGNEYLSQNNISEALNTYLMSYNYINKTQMYAPHLYYRIAICYHSNKEYENALKFIDEALQYYSANVDFVYLKGSIYYDWKKYTLAIKAFEKCLELGDDNSKITFINNCGTINPLNSLGDLYFKLEHFDKSLEYYNMSLKINDSQYSILYKIGTILNRLSIDGSEMVENLLKYFSSTTHLPNLILIIDILLNEKLYKEAKIYLDKVEDYTGFDIDKSYLKGKYFYLIKAYDLSILHFSKAVESKNSTNNLLSASKNESFQYLLAITLITNTDYFNNCLNMLNRNNEPLVSILMQFYSLYKQSNENYITKSIDNKDSLSLVEVFLQKLLNNSEIDTFQSYLRIYNYFDNDFVLLSLSKVYYNCGYKDLAVKVVFRSMKELSKIDYNALDILNDSIR